MQSKSQHGRRIRVVSAARQCLVLPLAEHVQRHDLRDARLLRETESEDVRLNTTLAKQALEDKPVKETLRTK